MPAFGARRRDAPPAPAVAEVRAHGLGGACCAIAPTVSMWAIDHPRLERAKVADGQRFWHSMGQLVPTQARTALPSASSELEYVPMQSASPFEPGEF
jgi:hypothetical protein